MSVQRGSFIRGIEQIAPPELAEDWDHCGMQIDLCQEYVQRVLVALEMTEDVVNEAVSNEVDFILTHHPLFFHPIRQINLKDPVQRLTVKLIQNNISVYSAHTSFDAAPGGNNDFLAGLLGLQDISGFPASPPGSVSIGRRGEWKQAFRLDELCVRIDGALQLKGEWKATGDPNNMIKKAALCTGSGGEFLEEAIKEGCDVYITGDVSYHTAQTAKAANICLIDAGHYGTEKFFVENIAAQLRRVVENKVCIIESKNNLNPFFNCDILKK